MCQIVTFHPLIVRFNLQRRTIDKGDYSSSVIYKKLVDFGFSIECYTTDVFAISHIWPQSHLFTYIFVLIFGLIFTGSTWCYRMLLISLSKTKFVFSFQGMSIKRAYNRPYLRGLSIPRRPINIMNSEVLRRTNMIG